MANAMFHLFSGRDHHNTSITTRHRTRKQSTRTHKTVIKGNSEEESNRNETVHRDRDARHTVCSNAYGSSHQVPLCVCFIQTLPTHDASAPPWLTLPAQLSLVHTTSAHITTYTRHSHTYHSHITNTHITHTHTVALIPHLI